MTFQIYKGGKNLMPQNEPKPAITQIVKLGAWEITGRAAGNIAGMAAGGLMLLDAFRQNSDHFSTASLLLRPASMILASMIASETYRRIPDANRYDPGRWEHPAVAPSVVLTFIGLAAAAGGCATLPFAPKVSLIAFSTAAACILSANTASIGGSIGRHFDPKPHKPATLTLVR